MLRKNRNLLKLAATIAFAIVTLVALIGFLDHPPSVGAPTQRIIDGITPGLVIGERIPQEMRARHRLQVSPYMGFTATPVSDSLGIPSMFVYVDEHIDDSRPVVSGAARLESITYFIADSARFTPVTRQLDAALGVPTPVCYMWSSERAVRQRTWHAAHGRDVVYQEFTTGPKEFGGHLVHGWISFASVLEPIAAIPCSTARPLNP